MKTAIIVKMTFQAGQRETAAGILESGLPNAESEVGTELYILHEDRGDENVLWMYELYTDDAALGVHGGSPELADVLGKLGPLFDGAPEFNMVTARSAAGHPV